MAVEVGQILLGLGVVLLVLAEDAEDAALGLEADLVVLVRRVEVGDLLVLGRELVEVDGEAAEGGAVLEQQVGRLLEGRDHLEEGVRR